MRLIGSMVLSIGALSAFACGNNDASETESKTNDVSAASSLLAVTEEEAGDNCEAGGIRVDVGVDDDRDRTLDDSEISATEYLCGVVGLSGETGAVGAAGPTGAEGPQGLDGPTGAEGPEGVAGPVGPTGPIGPTGPQGPAPEIGGAGGGENETISQTLTRLTPFFDRLVCEHGGILLELGVDDGAGGGTLNNGTLEAGEIDQSARFCNSGVCGDGVLDPAEDCDGELNCPEDCTLKRYVFVTSEMYDGNLGGLTGADQICQNHAESAGLRGTYKAWLSTAVASPSSSFFRSEVPYVLVNDVEVAASWDALISDQPEHPINRTETGGVPATDPGHVCTAIGRTSVWAATSATGTLSSFNHTCNNWTSNTGGESYWGDADSTTQNWSGGCVGGNCSFRAPLYCFQQ